MSFMLIYHIHCTYNYIKEFRYQFLLINKTRALNIGGMLPKSIQFVGVSMLFKKLSIFKHEKKIDFLKYFQFHFSRNRSKI